MELILNLPKLCRRFDYFSDILNSGSGLLNCVRKMFKSYHIKKPVKRFGAVYYFEWITIWKDRCFKKEK